MHLRRIHTIAPTSWNSMRHRAVQISSTLRRWADARRTGVRPRCFACQAAQQIDAALTGPDGSIHPGLAGDRDALTGLERPRSLLTNWHDLASLRLLSDIAAGRLELRHEALDALPQVFSVTHLRALLIVAGALPARDENI